MKFTIEEILSYFFDLWEIVYTSVIFVPEMVHEIDQVDEVNKGRLGTDKAGKTSNLLITVAIRQHLLLFFIFRMLFLIFLY